MNSPFIFSQSSTGAQTVPTTTIVIISARIAFFFFWQEGQKGPDVYNRSKQEQQFSDNQLSWFFYSLFSRRWLYISLYPTGVFSSPPPCLRLSQRRLYLQTNKTKNGHLDKIKNKNWERDRKEESGKRRMANSERENLNKEYKRGGGTYTRWKGKKRTRLVIGEQWRRKGTKEVASSACSERSNRR